MGKKSVDFLKEVLENTTFFYASVENICKKVYLFELQFLIPAYYWKNHKGRILRQLFTSHVTSRGLEMNESMLPVLLIHSWPSEVLHSSILKLGYGPKHNVWDHLINQPSR